MKYFFTFVFQAYYPIDGDQMCSIWMPVDPVPLQSTVGFSQNKVVRIFCLKLQILITTEQTEFYFLEKLRVGLGIVLVYFLIRKIIETNELSKQKF